jgi:hypothetical protein
VGGAGAAAQGERVDLPPLHRRQQLLADGYSDDEVRRQCRRGLLVPIRPGAYLSGALPDDAAARHLIAAAAAQPVLADQAVFSHVTAALRYGLPVWRIGLDRVHVTRRRRYGGRIGHRVHVHVTEIGDDEILEWDGMPMTRPHRTVIDLARTVPFEEAVVVTDGALRAGLTTLEELTEALARARARRGTPAARRVLAFADGRSESAGESRSRVAMHRYGLPAPVPQWEVRDGCGRLLGRTDFGWPQLRTVGEFDGRVKYGRLLRSGQSVTDAVLAEKRREDGIRAEDLSVVRWTWADLDPFTDTARRLRARFRSA